jgi:hypothetical protein
MLSFVNRFRFFSSALPLALIVTLAFAISQPLFFLFGLYLLRGFHRQRGQFSRLL